MRIDINQLSESELVDLNRKIVERLRMIRQVQAHTQMLEFTLGERVWFRTDAREVEGMLVRYNKKSVTVLTDNSERWTVSPGLLRRSAVRDSNQKARNVIEMHKSLRDGS